MRIIGLGALAGAAAALALSAEPPWAQDRPFRSMSVGEGRETLCEMPEVPAELVPTVGHEEAYQYWLEKLELEKRLKAGECECQTDTITWDDVGEKALPWLADTSRLFIVMRREIEAEIDALRSAVLMECAG